MCEAYGVWQKKQMFGRTYMGVIRSSFLIDGAGRIARAWTHVRLKGHMEAVLAAAQALQVLWCYRQSFAHPGGIAPHFAPLWPNFLIPRHCPANHLTGEQGHSAGPEVWQRGIPLNGSFREKMQ